MKLNTTIIIIFVAVISILLNIVLVIHIRNLNDKYAYFTELEEILEAMPSPEPFELSEPKVRFYDKNGNSWDSGDYTTQKP